MQTLGIIMSTSKTIAIADFSNINSRATGNEIQDTYCVSQHGLFHPLLLNLADFVIATSACLFTISANFGFGFIMKRLSCFICRHLTSQPQG